MTSEQKFNCIFCKDVFDNKEELQVHFRKHADPKFKSKNRFDSEPIQSEENPKEKSEMVRCDVCPLMFPTISKAITHKHKVHPDHDIKYFCPWCGKLFTMKHPYTIHIKTTHGTQKQVEEKHFHCDCCEVDFFVPSAMLYHNKFFHRQDSDIVDIGSSKKLRLYNQEIIQLYYCAFCGEEYENKVNLIKHTTDDHSDEDQSPEEILRCPLCDAIFYHLDAYEIHLSFHSTDDLYSANNEMFANLLDFSLETVPPIIEKVDNTDDMEPDLNLQGADADSTANALEIEKFLELAMGQTDGDGNPVKVKKKKHKKSKKSAAITLDEFLNMNKDVFGEGLDFQGVEEVPTRVVKKQLKNKKSANAAATAELEKLKEKGIVVMKVGATKTTKNVNKKIANKQAPNREITTSSEVLSKLINQSNNQIKIVKRSVVNKIDTGQIQTSTAEECSEDKKQLDTQKESKQDAKDIRDDKVEISPNIPDNTENENRTEEHLPTSTAKVTNIPVSKDVNAQDENDTEENMGKEFNHTSIGYNAAPIIKLPVAYLSPKQKECKTNDKSFDDKNDAVYDGQSDHEENDSEIDHKNTATDNRNIEYKDKSIDVAQSSNEKNNAQASLHQTDSLSTLKHLSHLTIKPINKNITPETTIDKITETKKEPKIYVNKDKEPDCQTISSDIEGISPAKSNVIVDKDPTLDALKMLSKNITIKSLATPTKINVDATVSENENDTESVAQNLSNNTNATNKNVTIKKIKIEIDEPIIDHKEASSNKNYMLKKIKVENSERYIGSKVINTINNTGKNISQVVNKINTSAIEAKSNKTDVDSTHNNVTKTTNTNILRNLPNITTKPLIVKNTKLQQESKQTKVAQKESEVIEISDIDDSDDDRGNQDEPKQDSAKPKDALKNLSKHITVKQFNQPATPLQKIIKVEKVDEPEYEEDQHDGFDSDDDHIPMNIKVCSQKLSSKNMAFKNALKNLSKNITVKSRTSSPSQLVQTQDHNSQDFPLDDVNEPASESDSDVGKVKITEIEEANHDENLEDMDDCDDPVADDDGPIVESPHDSCSDQEAVDETDFESEIKATTLQKTSQAITVNKNNICLNNLKNINKNITVKSVNSNPIDSQTNPKQTQSHEKFEETKNQTKQMVIKPPQQIIRETVNENICNNKNFRKVGKIVDQTSNESLNQKVSVNKEVTVKTYQSQTIIQEITTTVTKTIKTVNQTVNKQEARCSSQRSLPILPQKVVGMRPQMNSKNLQGVVIRHAAPVTVKHNNPGTQLRPAGTAVRASKQIVPMRPGLNVTNTTRPKAPRMQAPKTNMPKSSPNKQVMGKPLKFSPSVLTSGAIKRPNTEEVNGPFSCFKKPKESLIPVSDLPSYGGGDDSAVQMNASSHTSASNYTSTSKIVKGNSVVTATQMKSEMTSMQQFSRIGNAVGTKIKNTQFKQTQVQEKVESSAMQRTTLAAIEKLQKQGLLIKKPRVEVNETSDDDHIDDNSTEEQAEQLLIN